MSTTTKIDMSAHCQRQPRTQQQPSSKSDSVPCSRNLWPKGWRKDSLCRTSLTPRAVIAALIARPLVVLWPLGGLIFAIRNFRSPHAKPIAWLFCIYFGFVFIYGDPFSEGGDDSTRYAAQLIEMHKTQVSLNSVTSQFYVQGSRTMDIYNGLVTWCVSRFTGNPRWLFTIYALIFGFFYCQNLWLILERIGLGKLNALWWLCACLFVLVTPIWSINGVRMYTAAHVFYYGIMLFFLNNKWYGLVFAALASLIHFSYVLLIPILLLYYIFPKDLTILITIFFVCAFADLFDLEVIRKALSFMPEIYEDRLQGYASDSRAQIVAIQSARLNFHVHWANYSQRLIIYGFALIPYLKRGHWLTKRPDIKFLYGFALFFGSFAFLFDHVPSAGRFLAVTLFLLSACFVVLLSDPPFANQAKSMLLWFAPVIAFSVLFRLRIGLDNIGPMLFVGNPFVAFIIQDQTTVLAYIKWLFGF